MDENNRRDLVQMGVAEERLLLMRQFEPGFDVVPDVPDPYYGGPDGFEDAYQMLCENADRLLDYLEMEVADKVFSELVQMVNPPATIGRYKSRPEISARADDITLLRQLGFEYY